MAAWEENDGTQLDATEEQIEDDSDEPTVENIEEITLLASSLSASASPTASASTFTLACAVSSPFGLAVSVVLAAACKVWARKSFNA